jgi:hypothetical protein
VADALKLGNNGLLQIGAVLIVGAVIFLAVFLYLQRPASTGSHAVCVVDRYAIFLGRGSSNGSQPFVTYSLPTTVTTTLSFTETSGYVTYASSELTGTATGAVNIYYLTTCTVT